MKAWWFAVILLFAATPASALQNRPSDSCDWMKDMAWADCLTIQANAPTIYDYSEHGERVFEVFLTKHNSGALLQFVEVRATGAHRLEIRSLFDPTPPIILPLSARAWRKVAEMLKAWPTDAKAEKARIEKEREGKEFVCLHPVAGGFETNMAGLAPDAFFEGCDQPWDFKLADALIDAALAVVPGCKLLNDDIAYYDFMRLDMCTRLDGARKDAARAVNALLALQPASNDGKPHHAADFRVALAPDVRLSFESGRQFAGHVAVATGWEDAARDWKGAYLDFGQADGQDGAVEITGDLYIDIGDMPDAARYGAPYRQLWRRGPRGALVLQTWTVGKFVPAPRVY
jgi:hypothetical protein